MPVTTFVVVTDHHLYVGSGLVSRWFKRMNNNLWHNIVAAAPIRSGTLKAGIDLDYTQDASLRILGGVVASTAPHTQYVIEGTAEGGAGYIYSAQGWANRSRVERLIYQRDVLGVPFEGRATRGLWLGMNNPYPGKPQLRVHGQRPNNFLLTGYNRTARTHPALHPIFPGITKI